MGFWNIRFKDIRNDVVHNVVDLDEMLAYLNHVNSSAVLDAQPGSKYIKIVDTKYGSRSVYCFLDYQGNIYKSASWKAPAKHIRGTVFDTNYSWGKALGPYGAAYLR